VITYFTAGSYCSTHVNLGISGKKYYLRWFLWVSDIERATDGENTSTAGSVDDTTAMPDTLFTIGSYAELAAKTFITASYLARRGSIGHKPVVIRITTGYLKTVGESPGGELTFCSSDTPKHMHVLISRRGSEALSTLHRTYIHCFMPAGLGSPIPLVQPGMGPLSHRSFFPRHYATL
jgi:hypothetical protein